MLNNRFDPHPSGTLAVKHPKFSTPNSIWVRNNPDLSSGLGYVCTDIDFLWANYKTGKHILIEEKCRNDWPRFSQMNLLKKMSLANQIAFPTEYCGLWLVQFEKECATDGGAIAITNLDTGKRHENITPERYTGFLKMEWATDLWIKNYRAMLAAKSN